MGGGRQLLMLAIGAAVAGLIGWEAGRHGSATQQAESIVENLQSDPDVGEIVELDVRVDGATRTAIVAGKVDTAKQRQAATDATLRTRGLLTVYNDIDVDQILEALLVRLRQLMDEDETEGEFDYRIADDGHTVTLQGWVPEGAAEMREAIEQLVRQVPGVRQVHNTLSVGPPDEEISRIQEQILRILQLKNIYFDYNKAEVRKDSRESVERIAGVLKDNPAVRVRVEGHTDSIASEAYNQRLSEARAKSVRDLLVLYGVAPDRIDTRGLGEARPIAPNTTPEGRADNRRIEFTILRPGEILRPDENGEPEPGAGSEEATP